MGRWLVWLFLAVFTLITLFPIYWADQHLVQDVVRGLCTAPDIHSRRLHDVRL